MSTLYDVRFFANGVPSASPLLVLYHHKRTLLVKDTIRIRLTVSLRNFVSFVKILVGVNAVGAIYLQQNMRQR